jgi:hypothetical protein
MNTYSKQQFQQDLFNAMISRPNGGIYSHRALGNTVNIKLWSDEKVRQFYVGVVTAHKLFFNEVTLQDFARLIICESMQESTGDYRLGVKPVIRFDDHTSWGVIQVTPGSVLKDYFMYGKPIMNIDGIIVLNPKTVDSIDLSDPGICIIIWAWYVKNSVLMGVSMNEWINRVLWNIPLSGVTQDLGNCMLTWLAGPHNDRWKNNAPFADYYARILDYAIGSGFFDQAKFDQLLATKLTPKIIGMYESASARDIDNRDTCIGVPI